MSTGFIIYIICHIALSALLIKCCAHNSQLIEFEKQVLKFISYKIKKTKKKGGKVNTAKRSLPHAQKEEQNVPNNLVTFHAA